jgi:hypothetical protein
VCGVLREGIPMTWSDVIFLLGYWLFAVAYSVKVLALLR